MLVENCDSHKSMHELFLLNNYNKGDNACAIFHHNIQICGTPPTWANPLDCVQSYFQFKIICQRQTCMVFYLFFNSIAFKVSPWIPRSIWSVRVFNHLFGILIHRWFHDIQSLCMLPPVIAFFVVRHRFLSARHISHDCISNADVHNDWCEFFPLDTLQQNVSMFYPTPTKTRTSKITLPRFQMWTCMFPAASHLI